jgi:hypothetical protein
MPKPSKNGYFIDLTTLLALIHHMIVEIHNKSLRNDKTKVTLVGYLRFSVSPDETNLSRKLKFDLSINQI